MSDLHGNNLQKLRDVQQPNLDEHCLTRRHFVARGSKQEIQIAAKKGNMDFCRVFHQSANGFENDTFCRVQPRYFDSDPGDGAWHAVIVCGL